METRPLTSLTPGSRGIVAAIQIPPAHRGRLLEMGLLVGTPIEVIRFAPLGGSGGDPDPRIQPLAAPARGGAGPGA